MRAQLSSRDYEQISAYLDGQLGPNEARRFEDLLHTRPEMQAALDELGRTRALLRSAPRKHAPRSFAITPAMLGERGTRRPRGFSLNLFPALSFASALATLALVATILFQLLPGQPSQLTSNAPALSAPAAPAAPAPAAAPMLATAPESAPASGAGAAASASAAGPTQSAAAKNLVPQAADQAQPVPPVVTWSGGPAYGMGGGMGGGGATGSGGAAATGMGGGGAAGPGGGSPYLGPLLGPPVASGAANAPVYGLGGGGGATGSGGGTTLIIPPQAAAGLPAAQTAVPQAQSAAPALSGTGPILGIPAPTEAGQIIDQRSIQGFPRGESGAAPKIAHSQNNAADTGRAAAPAPAAANTILGLPRRLVLQILLGAIAVAAGLAAYFVRRSRA